MILIGLCVNLAVIGYVFYQSYAGREAVVKATRNGCERGKRDRKANALGWRTAEMARINGVAQQLDITLFEAEKMIKQKPERSDSTDLIAARNYDKIATGLERRSRISCPKAFPKAGLLP